MKQCHGPGQQKGFSLVELMVTIIIGLLVTLAVMNLFLTNTRTHRTTENLSRIQENARVAFELMAFDLRQAGGSPCGNVGGSIPVMNMLDLVGGEAGWSAPGIQGYDSASALPGVGFGNAAGNRVNGTDAIAYGYASNLGASIASDMPNSSADLTLTVNPGLVDGNVVMVCDINQAHIFQISQANGAGGINIVHNKGEGAPGNYEKCFWSGSGKATDIATVCSNALPAGVGHNYDENSFVVKYNSVAWYLGCNGRVACGSPGGRSIYQVVFPNAAQEVVPDVQDLQMQYLLNNVYQDATGISAANWANVRAVRITMTLLGPDAGATTNANPQTRLTRTLSHVVALRNQINE